MVEALDIQVKGIVQGVGFRPFVYRLAKKYGVIQEVEKPIVFYFEKERIGEE